MGWFSSKKEVYVSSSTWNLLGDQEPIDHIQYSLLESKLMDDRRDTAEVINDSLLTGPASTFRRFMRWAKQSQYNNVISLATSVYYDSPLVSRAKMAELLKEYLNTSNTVYVKDIYLGYYDYMYFGKQWIYQNKPEDLYGNYKIIPITVSDFKEDIQVTLVDGSVHIIDTSTIDKSIRRLYSEYEITIPYQEVPPEGGSPITKYKKELRILIYEKGNGYKPFDDLFVSSIPLYNSYAPFIPLRTWNHFISDKKDIYLPEVYKPAKQATKRALGANKYDELIEQCNKNEKINDIDFIYLSFGCPLNAPYQGGRKYIYQFFYNLFMGLATRPMNKKTNSNFFGQYTGIPKSVQIRSNSTAINYNIWLEWGGVDIKTKSGLCRPYAKVGKYYLWAILVDETYTEEYEQEGHGENGDTIETLTSYDSHEIVHICFQKSSQEYIDITITNLCQANLIYGGKSVIISAGDALGFQGVQYYSYFKPYRGGWGLEHESFDDKTPSTDPQTPDIDLSGFIVPIQYNTIMDMGLRRANDLIQECNNLIFNCYIVKKVKWYQTGFFKIFLSIVIVVIVVICSVYGGPAGGSTAAKLGGTIGGSIAGISAGAATATFLQVFIATAVNTMISMVVSAVIMKAATALLGDKLGLIIGTIASMIASYGINNWGNISEYGLGTTLSESLSNTKELIFNIGSATLSAVNTYTGLLGLKTAGIYAKMQTLQENYKNKMEEIEDLMKELSPNYILTYLFNSAILEEDKRIPYETSDMFLGRTLMVGSDIRNLNLAGIHDMADITLEPQLT